MTAAELVIAVFVSLFLTLGLFSFSSFFNQVQHEYNANIRLTNDARIVMEQLVWGYRAAGQTTRHGIAEATSGTIVNANEFRYTDVSAIQHTIRLNNGRVEYQRGVSAAWTTLLDVNGSEAQDATKYSTQVVFSQPVNANSVNLQVVVGKNILGKWHYGSASTQVYFRNS